MKQSVVVAGMSARMMVDSLRDGGIGVIALDLFGDEDTRAAGVEWHAIGDPNRLAFDDELFLEAIVQCARRGDVVGWVAGSGFEARTDLLARGAALLPLLGNAAGLVQRVRTPGWFYPWLVDNGVAHAEVSIKRPAILDGWLVKNARACGGWHVRPAGRAEAASSGGYYQRRVDGPAMSVLFLADRREWRIVGVARQIVRPLCGHPYVYRGGIGPVVLPPGARLRLEAMLGRLVSGLGLCGLNGIDFILSGDEPLLIELNPRPTATLALFDSAIPGGLMQAHVEVCRGAAVSGFRVGQLAEVRGSEVVYARRAGVVDTELGEWMAGQGWCRDVPAAGTRHAFGDPVCSVIAQGRDAAEVECALAAHRDAVAGNLDARSPVCVMGARATCEAATTRGPASAEEVEMAQWRKKEKDEPYDEAEIKARLEAELPDWYYENGWIRRKYRTSGWKGTLMVINTVGHLAEAAFHHPDIAASYAFVIVKLMNHAAKGVTDKDFELAKKIEEVVMWQPGTEGGALAGTPDDPRFSYIKY